MLEKLKKKNKCEENKNKIESVIIVPEEHINHILSTVENMGSRRGNVATFEYKGIKMKTFL